jgi:choline dehydrogenase
MQDNYESPLAIHAESPWTTSIPGNCTFSFNDTDPCFTEWIASGEGFYGENGGTLFFTWKSSQTWDNDTDLFFLSIAGYSGRGFYPGYSIRVPAPNNWGTSIVKMQTGNPLGTVTLRSADPRQAPAINFNYFEERAEEDIQALVEGVELMLGVYDQLGINYTRLLPNPEIDMRQAIKDEAFGHHATSTCRMGPVDNKEYCVDSRFRVQGVDNLRVVDASIWPRVPGAFPNGPTFTLSRKALQVILEDNYEST